MRLIDADDLPISSIDITDVGYYVSKYGQGIPAVYLEDIEDAPTIELPTQPKIIRCNSCKHWTQTIGEMRGFGLGICDFHNAEYVTCNGFCYWAEGREDEQTDRR